MRKLSALQASLIAIQLGSTLVPAPVVRAGGLWEQEYSNGEAMDLRENQNSKQIRFEKVLTGSMVKKGAISVSFQDYKADDGALLESRVESYSSPSRAKGEMRRAMERVARVVERGTKVDERGRVVGERVVIAFGKGRAKSRGAAVIWRDGSSLHYIESSSLHHVLEFERMFHPSN